MDERQQCSSVIIINGWSYRCHKSVEFHEYHWWNRADILQTLRNNTPVQRVKWFENKIWLDVSGVAEFGPIQAA